MSQRLAVLLLLVVSIAAAQTHSLDDGHFGTLSSTRLDQTGTYSWSGPHTHSDTWGLTGILHSILPAEADGSMRYCTDCNPGSVPCASGGTGSFAFRENAQWNCHVAGGGGAGGDNITINGVSATDPNFNDTLPAAPAGNTNVLWQKDTAAPDNVSAYVPGSHVQSTLTNITTRDHDLLAGLTDDDHSQYVLLAGRGAQQDIHGGADASGKLVLSTTSNVSKGVYVLQDLALTGFLRTDGAGVVSTAPIADSDVPDTITVSNYLPLAGGTMVGDINMSGVATQLIFSDDVSANKIQLFNGYQIGLNAFEMALYVGETNADFVFHRTLPAAEVFRILGSGGLKFPDTATPTVAAFGEMAADNDIWAASRGAPVFYDGTASVTLVGALTSDPPTNGQVLKWNTGGTITWEDDNAGGGAAHDILSVTHSDTTVTAKARGGLLRVNAAATAWEQLAVGTNLQVLASDGTDPAWTALTDSHLPIVPITKGGTGQATATAGFDALSPTTTRGDVIRRGAAVNERLALGAVNTFLASDGTDPNYRLLLASDIPALTKTAYVEMPIGACQGTTGLTGVNLKATGAPTPTCDTGTNINEGVLRYASGSLTCMEFAFRLPDDIATAENIDLFGTWRGATGSTSTVGWQVATKCIGDGEAKDQAYTTADTFTDAGKAVANQHNDFSQTALDKTGCTAEKVFYLNFCRQASDAYTDNADLAKLQVKIRRTE